MCSGVGNRTCLLLGFPIRKSSDQSLVDSSPRLFAASYVLHRLLVPRHPPCALTNLATNKRCSRPLCSSQGTGDPSPTPLRGRGSGGWTGSDRGTEVAALGHSLRTQQ